MGLAGQTSVSAGWCALRINGPLLGAPVLASFTPSPRCVPSVPYQRRGQRLWQRGAPSKIYSFKFWMPSFPRLSLNRAEFSSVPSELSPLTPELTDSQGAATCQTGMSLLLSRVVAGSPAADPDPGGWDSLSAHSGVGLQPLHLVHAAHTHCLHTVTVCVVGIFFSRKDFQSLSAMECNWNL